MVKTRTTISDIGKKISPLPRVRRPTLAVNWQLEAVKYVRFLMGQGYRRIGAQQAAAMNFNRTIDDLQTWERELVKADTIENELICAELAGELNEYLLNSHFSSIPHYKVYGSFNGHYNVDRASTIAQSFRKISVEDIRAGLRTQKRVVATI